ncbi:otoferlin-like [Lineus longissimus]|uniref:otoferlin-like n=1 Tax=Lineus longissimus TaxID=88925 RepID=UPI00315D7463
MALVLQLKYAENLRGKADRLAKVSFRGVSHYSKIIEGAEDCAVFDETFEWPVARPIESDEVVDIQVFNYNRYLSNRLLGTFKVILQQIVVTGHLKVTDSIIDINNVVMKTNITFELVYNAPDGSVGNWQRGGFEEAYGVDQYDNGRTEDEMNMLNMERYSDDTASMVSSPEKSRRGSRMSVSSKTSKASKSPMKPSLRKIEYNPHALLPGKIRAVGKMLNLTKRQRKEKDDDTDSFASLEDENKLFDTPIIIEPILKDDDDDGSIIAGPVTTKKLAAKPLPKMEQASLKAQDFQVCITIIEARQLAGLNMDPVVCVQVGDQKKYTSVKESTNCPYYNEYFVFDFHMAPAMLFDKIVNLTVLQSRNFIRSNKPLGSFKFDVGTVYGAQDHQFYHKWAMLTDSEDINGGPKGYLKCDIAVIGKGDSVKLSGGLQLSAIDKLFVAHSSKVPPSSDKDEDDIEANLLLPDGVPADRSRAQFIVKIYRAEGLPKMNTGIMANVKKAFTGEAKDLVDPYVQVTFAGHTGKTSVKKGAYEPIWNEQVVFTEMFPPLCRRMRIQLRDSDSVNDDVIGTHFLDLAKISDDREKGFLPTFGPVWVNLYGSTRDYSLLDEHKQLNEGLGEGVSFRARLLIALKTDILDSQESGPAQVDIEPALPISENAAGRPEEYFVFASVLEAGMIEKKVGDKPIHFEISIGNAGNLLDGYNESVRRSGDGSDSEEGEEPDPEAPDGPPEEKAPQIQSTTGPAKPITRDRYYYHMPYHEEKPCVYLKAYFEDHRRRMYNINILEKIGDKLESGLADVQEMIRQEKPFPERRLRGVLEELMNGCSRYQALVKGSSGGAASGRTKLDKERLKMSQREMDHIKSHARTLKGAVTKVNVKERLKLATSFLAKIRHLADEPQHALPDVFLWMVSGANKRIAYQRLPAKDLLYSIVEEECGKLCGKVQTLFLRLPGKKATGQTGWAIQSKLQIYMWLGLTKHKKDFLRGLPGGYEETKAVKASSRISAPPPQLLRYSEKQTFQLRGHMYQARSLIGSDDTGLSDPFARVIFGDQSLCTQVIDETLSPTWDETLIFNEVCMYGMMEDILYDPPTILIEIFDQDSVGKCEFLGRALAKPQVKLCNEKYEPPKFPVQLEWWDVYRGPDRAGELLACFELLQYPFDERELQRQLRTPIFRRKVDKSWQGLLAPQGHPAEDELPKMDLPVQGKDRGPIMPVPKGIRPTLSKHRIEILFWGVRDLKRLQLQSVDRPRVDVECAGHILQSSVIANAKKNPNFTTLVKLFDVDLPDNELYCPPITIRCVDCRNFGRFVLVGTHVINNIQKFRFVPTTKSVKNAAAMWGVQSPWPFWSTRMMRALGKFTDKKEPDRESQGQLPALPAPGLTVSQTGTPHGQTPHGQTPIGGDRVSLGRQSGQDTTVGTPAMGGKIGSMMAAAKQMQQVSNKDEIAINIDEKKPLIGGNKDDTVVTVSTPHIPGDPNKHAWTAPKSQEIEENDDLVEITVKFEVSEGDAKEQKTEENKKKKKKADSEEDKEDQESLDWWSKYFASVETMIKAQQQLAQGDSSQEQMGKDKEEIGPVDPLDVDKKLPENLQMGNTPTPATGEGDKGYGTLPNGDAAEMGKDKDGKNSKLKFKGAVRATGLASKLSPKAQRKKDKVSPASQLTEEEMSEMTVYPNELESQNDFNGFKEWLHTFDLYRGKKTGDEMDDESRVVGKFKGSLMIYKVPLPPDIEDATICGGDPSLGMFQGLPNNDPIHVLVRVYVVKANDLHPADLNGKADPYCIIKLGKTVQNDKENYISKQLSPVFGKCFEIEATFPMESMLNVQIYDWDLVGTDDLIGETKVDLENRYYSKHRATCGLARKYEIHGYNAWRDPNKPTQILAKLCKDYKVEGPSYSHGKVRVGNRVFTGPMEIEDENASGIFKFGKNQKSTSPNHDGVVKATDEHLALAALNNWHEIPKVGTKLVPEHVETRALFNPDKPGIEQGKLEMWVDMFPMDMPLPGAPVDISPRKPKSLELRCIIWNTDDVVLEDDAFFTGDKMSDIYVKGWVKGQEDMQATDVHYRSLTGEGNFNWRFIFPFDYLQAEEKIVITKKESLFSWDETETKIPARLNLQVWDADHFSADDFLGSLTLDLNRFPRGAKSSKRCSLDMLKTDGSVPQMSLFKHKRVKGWWPFAVKDENSEEVELTGKVEAEMHLMTQEEAEKHPAGIARNEPEPLDKPNRPDSSFIWFCNPLKSIRYILWHNYKWVILKVLIVLLLTAILALFFYSMPGYIVKRMFGA